MNALTGRSQETWVQQALPILGKTRWRQLLYLTILLGILVWVAKDFAHRIPVLEHWIASHGPVGWLVFVVVAVLLTSMFCPDTAFAVIAGVLYGAVGGTILMVIASLCAAALDYALARVMLRDFVNRMLSKRPQMQAIQRAVNQEGFRFQFLLRLTPVNPVAVSYALGASGTRFAPFLFACAGMIPVLAVEVYFGHAAKHVTTLAGGVSKHSPMHTVFLLVGLALCVAVLIYITRVARRSLTAYEIQAVIPNNPEPNAANTLT